MEIFVAVFCIALNLIMYYQVVVFCAMGILVIGVWQKNQKKMLHTLAAFLLAVVFVIGIPLGLMKTFYPETDVPQTEILKEVQKWS